MKTKEELLERTEILLELCDIRLGDGKDQIAISGPYVLIRYLEDIKAYLDGPEEPEDEDADELPGPGPYGGLLEAAQGFLETGDVGAIMGRLMESEADDQLEDLMHQLKSMQPPPPMPHAEPEPGSSSIPVVVLRFDNGPLFFEEEITGPEIPQDAVVVCRANSELAGVLKSKAKAFRHFDA